MVERKGEMFFRKSFQGYLDKATIGPYNQNMSPSEIQQILQKINIQSGAMENALVPEAVFVLLQLVEQLNQQKE